MPAVLVLLRFVFDCGVACLFMFLSFPEESASRSIGNGCRVLALVVTPQETQIPYWDDN
jgi:hypothetical protein